MKAIEAFRDLPTTKDQVATFSDLLIDELRAGEIEPLKMKILMRCLEVVSDRIKPLLDELARDDAEKYGEKEFTLMGAKVRLAEVGAKYDYSGCGDSAYKSLEDELSKASHAIKSRQEWLKSLDKPITVVNEDTGEVEQISPPVKSSKSSLVITI